GEGRGPAAHEGRFGAGTFAHEPQPHSVCGERCAVFVAATRERARVEEVELVEAETTARELRVKPAEVRGRSGMGDVEDAQPLAPVPAGPSTVDEPFRVRSRELAALAHEEGRCPDACDFPGARDALGCAPDGPEA